MYTMKKTSREHIDWIIACPANIRIINWKEYPFCPNTTAWLLHSEYGIHVKMETDEQPLLARHTQQNSAVCTDSCMEFFLCPNQNDPRYLNFEFNPLGTMYLAVRSSRYDGEFPSEDAQYFDVDSQVSEGKWTLRFTIPFAFIDKVFGGHTHIMRGNLYKCGDETEHPHYTSYYPVNTERPDFHQPRWFGEFILE